MTAPLIALSVMLKSVSSSQLIATDWSLMFGFCHSVEVVILTVGNTGCQRYDILDTTEQIGKRQLAHHGYFCFFSPIVDKQFSFLHFFPLMSLTHLFCPPALADQLKSVLLPSRTWMQISAQAFFTVLKIMRRSFCKRLEKLNGESLLLFELRHRPSDYLFFFCISCGVFVLHAVHEVIVLVRGSFSKEVYLDSLKPQICHEVFCLC